MVETIYFGTSGENSVIFAASIRDSPIDHEDMRLFVAHHVFPIISRVTQDNILYVYAWIHEGITEILTTQLINTPPEIDITQHALSMYDCEIQWQCVDVCGKCLVPMEEGGGAHVREAFRATLDSLRDAASGNYGGTVVAFEGYDVVDGPA